MDGGWRQQLQALSAAGQLEQAAALAARHGEHAEAATLYERACAFSLAAAEALTAADLPRAVRLAVLGHDTAVRDRATSALIAQAPPERVATVADDVLARGRAAAAAALYRGIGRAAQAAEAYQKAGEPALAAACWGEAEEPARAARVLEAALRSAASEPEPLRLALGQLYARYGKHRAAVRVLQQLPSDSEWRTKALATLATSLEALGLRQALKDLGPEIERAGIERTERAEHTEAATPSGGGGAMLFGRYRVEREVAVTPHARLLEATDEVASRLVAIKLLVTLGSDTGRDALSRFVREARALGQLRHPHVVPLYDYLPAGPALVLGWMAGGSLRELVDREPVSPARAAEITGAVLSALAEAHRLGILHRDVKPSNVLFDGAGAARLGDFGAAHLAESGATVTQGEIGTVAYMSPEQRRGEAANVQSDIYGAGAILYEMLSGERSRGSTAVSGAHPDLDDRHDAVLARLMALRAEDRYGSAKQAHDALLAVNWSPRQLGKRRISTAALVTAAPAARPAAGDRLGPARDVNLAVDGGPRHHDGLLGRDVLVLPLDESLLDRAATFARADHPALQTVLRADLGAHCLWLEAPSGRCLSADVALGGGEIARLRAALQALHAAGGVHGAVDAEHVWRRAGGSYLVFAVAPEATASPEADLEALAALPQRPPAGG